MDTTMSASANDHGPKIYRPIPQRPFDYDSAPQQPPSPLLSPQQTDESPSRTHSILNLTSSTLRGIYSPSDYQSDTDYAEPISPWGTGAESPLDIYDSFTSPPRLSKPLAPPATPPPTFSVFSLVWRSVLLFGIGMGYGALVRHLHDSRQLAPFQVERLIKPKNDWRYLVFWGIAGVAVGSLQPWIDTIFSADIQDCGSTPERSSSPASVPKRESGGSNDILGADWTPVIRSVGAFVGIAFAIRKLPWSSNLQVSLTLFLVNPALWYLIDRSKPGFILSSAVGAIGTTVLLASNPHIMPSPTFNPAFSSYSSNNSFENDHMPGDLNVLGMGIEEYVSRENMEAGIWILSVLFCSCVCFGNIGRRLALSGVGKVL